VLLMPACRLPVGNTCRHTCPGGSASRPQPEGSA
jgi:hypothetical protein